MPIGPVFVAGCPRSGTSALSWAVAAHPDYWTSAETHFFYYLLRTEENALARSFKLSDGEGSWLDKHGVHYPEFLQHVGTGFDALMRSRSGGLQWVDGSPENVLVAEELLTMFPNAQLLNLVRDPRAVCRSMLTSGFDTPWARDADEAVRTWNHYARIGIALEEKLPDRVLPIRQEEMLAEPDAIAAAIGRRLALADAAPIARFLATRRVNSSFDKSSYARESPFRTADAPLLSTDEFEREYGARITDGTRELAGELGYRFD